MKKNYMNKKLAKKNSKKLMAVVLASTLCATPVVYAQSPLYTGYVTEITDSVMIIEQQGWLESAFVMWQPVAEASGYNVYYKGIDESDEAYTQLDDELIRLYEGYFRADAIGLPEGDYVMKVVPIFDEVEEVSKQAVTSVVSVKAHTREGFAFSKESPMGTGSGGYNDDGSIPKEAQIMYISADTVNTVALGVITDSKGKITTATGLVNILAARQKGYDKRPLIIRMVGTIKDSDIIGLNSSGYIQIKGSYNTTFEGVGEDATAYGWGFLLREAHNVELRNVGVMLFKDDGISLDTKNENIWVHNNDIFYGSAGSDSDQAKGDGSCDVKGFSNYVTVSYNHFWDAGKSSLCGMSDSEEFFVTYHHNWYDHSDSRHPRIRVGTIHIYNNYFDGNSKYGVGITKGGSAFVEANDFRNCKYPMLISLQGSDVANGNQGTFSGEPGGIIKAYNNQISGAARLVYQSEDEKEFDAYLAQTREEQVSDTYQSVSGGNTYNNFDTNEKMYRYTPDRPEDVRSNVTTYSGRMNGGDFDWTFTEADDTDYGVNAGLMSAIRSYESGLVSIGGGSTESPDTGNPDTGNPDTGNPDLPQGDIEHNFTADGKESDFFKITGNLSKSNGTVTYKGMTLTQCLKLESSTSVTFTTAKPATLVLVLESGSTNGTKINNIIHTAVNGIITVELEPGNHEIKKQDKNSIFYMSLDIMGDEETDEKPPVFSYEGATTIQVANGETFTLPEVTAQDEVDGVVEVTAVITDSAGKVLESIDTKVAGTYTITYGAEDQAGNKASMVLTVIVAEETLEPGNPDVSKGSIVHNFTESGAVSDFFKIEGNLATNKGSVSYDGLKLTQCLKLETSTKVEFTTTQPVTMTLVLDDTFSKNVVIDGVKTPASNGRLVVDLEAGKHTIAKGDTANLFYILLEFEEETGEVKPLPDSVNITSVTSSANNSFNVDWAPVNGVDYYQVSYKLEGDETFTIPEKGEQVLGTSFNISGLTVGKTYTIKVTAFRGEESTSGTVTKELEEPAPIQKEWHTANIGTGAAGTVKVNSDQSVTIHATNGKMAESEDGFTYYYTEIDPDTENFTLTATFKIDDAENIDNQSGFGIIAIDTLGGKSKEDKYFNSAGAIITKYNQIIDDATVSEYGLPGGRFITGYTLAPSEPDPNWGTRKNIDTSPFDWDYRADEFDEKVPRYKTGDTYTLTLRKSNTGFHASMEGQDKEVICYEPDLLLKQEDGKYYVGLFTSRNIKATISDIDFKVVHPSADNAQVERPVKYFDASLSYDATTTSSSGEYEAAFKSNVMGTLEIKDEAGNVVVSDLDIKNKDRNVANLQLQEGVNTYTATLTPSPREEQDFSKYQELNSYAPITQQFTISHQKYGTSENAIYVSPNGSEEGAGTKAEPLDIHTAINYVQPGQQIVLLGGTYEMSQSILINRGNSGTEENPVVLMSNPGERAVLDFSNASGTGITLKGDYWHLYDLEIKNANKSGIRIHGNHNTLEKLEIHDNKDTGLQISGFSTESPSMWPANNLVLSCESYNNCDRLGNDADGFAAKLTVGAGNVFRYCISHHNIDDGWDLYAKSTTGPIEPVLVEKCVTYANGKTTYSDMTGEGNGFKLGGESMPGKHVLKDSISFNNLAKGITSNSGPDCQIYNNISYNNGAENVSLYTYVKETDYVIQNMIGYQQGKKDKYAFGVTQAKEWKNDGTVFIDGSNGKTKVSDSWFTSLNTSIIPTIEEDGSINMNGLLQLTSNAPFEGPVFGPNPNPTVIEIGKEIEPEKEEVVFEWDYTGETALTIKVGDTFEVPVITATNNTGEEVTVTVTITDGHNEVVEYIDTTVADTYTVTYKAMDILGNESELVITLIVTEDEVVDPEEPLDTKPPVFDYEGSTLIKVANGEIFEVPTIEAIDEVDGIVSVEAIITNAENEVIEYIDTTVAGTYKVTYKAVDQAGNQASMVIIVMVEEAVEEPEEIPDTEAPLFRYQGKETIKVAYEQDFTVPEVKAFDLVDGEVAVEVVITNNEEEIGAIDTTIPGVYTITYTAIDEAGNEAVMYITVEVGEEGEVVDPEEPEDVVDIEAPLFRYQGKETIEVVNGGDFTVPEVKAFDLVDGEVDVEIGIIKDDEVLDTIDTTVAGTYTITYTASDAAGNLATMAITVIVAEEPEIEIPDTKAPEFIYNGSTIIDLANGEYFITPRVNAVDDTDGEVEVEVVIINSAGEVISSIDTTVADTYRITYAAADKAGNTATMTIVVIVAEDEIVEPEEPDTETPDTKAPELKYDGVALIEVAYGAAFTVPVVTAIDEVDGSVDVDVIITDRTGKVISSIDTKVAGTYRITYTATDKAGNSNTLSLVVKVKEKVVETPDDDEEDYVPPTNSDKPGNGGNSVTPAAPSVADTVDTALKENKDPVVNVNQAGMVKVASDVVQKVVESGKELVIKATDTISIGVNTQTLKEQGDNSLDIKVVQPAQEDLKKINAVVKADKNLQVVGAEQFVISMEIISNETTVNINEPVSITFDLSKEKVGSASKLTAVRYERQEDGTMKLVKIGGKYDVATGQFKFLTDQTGTFGLVEAENLVKVNLEINAKEAVVNGETLSNDVAPKIVDNRTMLPVRFIAESLGAKVGYKNGQVTITLEDKTIGFKVGEVLEGYNVKPFIEESRTYISARWVAEALGANVLWVPSSESIEIVK